MNIKLLFLLLMFHVEALSQSITGTVQDSAANLLTSVNVLLVSAKDSGLVKGSVTDDAGRYRIDNVPSGNYLIVASRVGHIQAYSLAFPVTSGDKAIQVPMITLSPDPNQLHAVTVTARRPLIEQKLDRTVLNVANSIIGSGSTVLEVLEKAPGVTIDRQNDQISLRGKEGVIVQIDGKQTFMPMTDVVALLKNMPSDNVDRIELITNPSAKYDAAGNAGIIDIRLKKNNNVGTNGSASVTIGSGRYTRRRASLQLNHRTERMNLFGSYSANLDENYWDFDIRRTQTDGTLQNHITSLSFIHFENEGHNLKTGLDYFITKRTTLGVVWTSFWSKAGERSPAHTLFRKSESGPVYLHTLSDKRISNPTSNHLANLNIQHTFAKSAQLSADFDIAVFERDYLNTLKTQILIPSTPVEPVSDLNTQMPTSIHIVTFKSDFSSPLHGTWKIEAGIKSSSVRSDNDVELKTGTNGTLVKDTALSNHFKYAEDVQAAYVNFSGKLNEKTSLMFGARAEYTHSVGNSVTLNNVTERNYLNLFPSLFLSHTINKQNTVAFSYSYRIDRPNYQSLNPARSYLDPYTYGAGNPYLRPQYTHSLELRHGFREKLFTSLAASYVNDLQFYVIEGIDDKLSRRMPENIGQSKAFSLTVTLPIKMMNGWNMQGTVMGIYSFFDYKYKGQPIKVQQMAGTLNVTNTFNFGKGWAGELAGWLKTPSVIALQQAPWLGSLDAGVQKTISPRWRAKLTLQDLLHTNKILFSIDAPGFSSAGSIKMDTRLLMFNVAYSFGNQKLKSSRQRKTAAEEEIQRTN